MGLCLWHLENEVFFAPVPTSHWLLCLPSNSVLFWEVELDGNVIMNPRTEAERSLEFTVFLSKGKLRPRDAARLLHRPQDT